MLESHPFLSFCQRPEGMVAGRTPVDGDVAEKILPPSFADEGVTLEVEEDVSSRGLRKPCQALPLLEW